MNYSEDTMRRLEVNKPTSAAGSAFSNREAAQVNAGGLTDASIQANGEDDSRTLEVVTIEGNTERDP